LVSLKDSSDPRVAKLEEVIRKGEAFISILEKKGIDIGDSKDSIIEAKGYFDKGDLSRSYKLAQEGIKGLIKLKAETEEKEKGPLRDDRAAGLDQVKVVGPETPEVGEPKKEVAEGGGGNGEVDKTTRKRGKGVFALIRDSDEETRKKVDEWKVITARWREKGYNFESDDKLFSHPFDELEKRFLSVGTQIEQAEKIRDLIRSLLEEYKHVGGAYRKKLEELNESLFKLERMGDIERRLDNLQKTLRAVEGRYRVLWNRMSRYKRSGLDVTSLEEVLENDEDLDYLEKQFNVYETNTEFLTKEKAKLKNLKEKGVPQSHRGELQEIEGMINNPWKLDTIVERMLKLENAINDEEKVQKLEMEEKKRREEISRNISEYKKEGFKVGMVEQLLEDDMTLLEEEYDNLEEGISHLKALKERLFKLDAKDFEEEVSNISLKLDDPENLREVEGEIEQLKKRINDKKKTEEGISDTIKEWESRGFMINKLKDTYNRDFREGEKLFREYSEKIQELKNIESKLHSIKHNELNDLKNRIAMKMKNPDLLDVVKRDFATLTKKVEELDKVKEKRKELNELLKVWKGQGYAIDNILEKMKEEDTYEGLEKIILDYTRSIATLESFKVEFGSEERGWFPEDEEIIKKNLWDPEKVKLVLFKYDQLKVKYQKEEKKRGQLAREIQNLEKAGLDTSSISEILHGDRRTIEETYEKQFKPLAVKLLKLKKDLLTKAHREKDKELEKRVNEMTDPFRYDEYRDIGKSGSIVAEGKRPTHGKEKKAVSRKDQDKISSLKDLAKKAFKEGRLLESLGLFEAVLGIAPDDKEGLFYKKKVLLKIKLAQAEKDKKEEEGKTAKEEKKEPVEEPAVDQEEGPAVGPEPDKEKEDSAAEVPKGEKEPDPNCISCNGSGKCSWCNGSGECSSCGGSGEYFGDECPTCKGSGKCSVCEGTGRCSWCSM